MKNSQEYSRIRYEISVSEIDNEKKVEGDQNKIKRGREENCTMFNFNYGSSNNDNKNNYSNDDNNNDNNNNDNNNDNNDNNDGNNNNNSNNSNDNNSNNLARGLNIFSRDFGVTLIIIIVISDHGNNYAIYLKQTYDNNVIIKLEYFAILQNGY